MSNQLKFSFDSESLEEENKDNNLYNYCVNNNLLDLLDEFDSEKNNITPKDIKYNSTKKVWWKCKVCGYSYLVSVNARTNYYSSGCPLCKNKVVEKGVNDLETLYPIITTLWDYEKNGDKKPYMYLPTSNETFCFKCNKKHLFTSKIDNLVKTNFICPICAKRKIYVGYNDIFTLYPNIEKEYDKELNKDIDPYKLTKSSKKKIYFRCRKNHVYISSIYNKINKNELCPYCIGIKPIIGENDLKTVYPKIYKEFDKSNKIDVLTLPLSSTKKLNWKCKKCKTIFKRSIVDRIKGIGCPKCKKK